MSDAASTSSSNPTGVINVTSLQPGNVNGDQLSSVVHTSVSSLTGVAVSLPNVTASPSMIIAPSNTGAIQSQMTNIQALAQTLQSSTAGGNIVVLNVGGTNDLASTLTQLFSANPLNSNAFALLGAAPQKPLLPTVTTQAETSQVTAPQPTTSATAAIAMNVQPNIQAALIPQQIAQPMIPMKPQLPQQLQEPATYMIVPIPQPAQVQHPVIFNVQNQFQGHVQVQPQPQPLKSFYVQPQQQHQLVTSNSTMHSHVMGTPSIIQQSPRSEELRSYLTTSHAGTSLLNQICSNNSPSGQTLTSTVSNVSTNGFVPMLNTSRTASLIHGHTNYSRVPQISEITPTSIHNIPAVAVSQYSASPQMNSGLHSALSQSETTALSQSESTCEQKIAKPSLPSRQQPNVSSPGLAFLAQVSSLTSGTHPIPSHSFGNPGVIEDFIPHQENSNLPVLPLDDVKAGAPDCEESTSHRNSMTVSSTTKIGDDGLDALPSLSNSGGSAVADNFTVNAESTCPNSDANTDGTLKRKKKMPSFPLVIKEKKKKGPAPKLTGNELCLICSDRASGFHYNTLSCEGCKGFFRRTVIKGSSYQCKQNGECIMDLYTRRKCQKCRFDKCKSVGMREESVLSEEKIKAKKQRKESENLSPSLKVLDESSTPLLTQEQRNLLKLLQANERRFQWPSADDVKKVTAWVEDDNVPHSRALRFAHFTEMCILIVQLVVEFTKQLPGFLRVLREDQIVLLKACAIEVMLLRAAKAYNKHDGTINFLNEKFYDKSTFYKAGIQVEFVDPIFTFCKSMARLDLDETEYAILVAINTFSSDRPHIKDVEKVENMQDPYVELLRLYTRIRHPNDPLMFARILMKIVELRSLNNYHSEQMFALKVQDQKLPPLLAEIWDM